MSTFQYSQDFSVTEEIRQSFWQQGFVILKNLFSEPEISKLLEFYENSEEIQKHAYGRDDGLNKKTKVEAEESCRNITFSLKVCLWNFAGDDIGDMVSRSEKVVTTFEELLGCGELYHYHSKLMMKEARTGGQHVWHQDYGYWYLG